ncbi:MAG: META domain-containing protein, partial [Prevotella sp.]
MKKIIAAICTVAAMSACSTGQQAQTIDALNGEWNIVKIEGKSLTAIFSEDLDTPFIGFDTATKRVYGSTGCNRLTGALNTDGQAAKLDFSMMGLTRKMCKDMQLEQQVLSVLEKVKGCSIKKSGTLFFKDADGNIVR